MGEWQRIETAPRDGTEILVWDRDVAGLEVAWWSDTVHRWLNEFRHLTSDALMRLDRYELASQTVELPSHWMPLPAPPVVDDD